MMKIVKEKIIGLSLLFTVFIAGLVSAKNVIQNSDIHKDITNLEDEIKVITGEVNEDKLKFYTTSVSKNGLNPSDRVEFEKQFKVLEYTCKGSNPEVSSTELNKLLQVSDYTILYHTGHGYSYGVKTSDGYLQISQVKMVNVRNFISATCETLSSTEWISKMGSSCQNILGYTELSYDFPVDDNVVKKLASEISKGRSFIQAWYIANVNQRLLKDRWCGYVRENGIFEYSARTGSNPKSPKSLKPLTKDGRIKVESHLLVDKKTFDSKFEKIRNYEIIIKGNREEQSDFYQEIKSEDFLKKNPMEERNAISIAQSRLGKKLSSDIKLDSVTPVEIFDNNGARATIGYIVRYTREMDGLSLRTNGVDDYVALLINDNKVVAMSKVWSILSKHIKPDVISKEGILSVSEAIRKASTCISSFVKGDASIEIIDVKPCYGIDKDRLVPAYELLISDGSSIIVNAITAQLVF